MAREFKCKECGTGYTTVGNDVPPSPNWADGHVCEMAEVECELVELTYKERILWFMANYYETGMEYQHIFESFKDSDLDNFKWYNETISFPKYKSDIVEVEGKTAHSHKSMETGEYLASKEARERAFGYMKLKKSQCQGHSEFSENEEERENRMKIIAQNGNDGLHY